MTSEQRRAAADAQTLRDFYAAFGREIPAQSERPALYHALGLGAPSVYCFSAMQNARMLLALKRLAGVA
jgi:hypothetical protein